MAESHYGDGTTHAQVSTKTVDTIQEQRQGHWTHRVYTRIAAMTLGRLPSLDDKAAFWDRVAFHNLITSAMSKPRLPPTTQQWDESIAALGEVIDHLRPHLVVVMSSRAWWRLVGGEGWLHYEEPNTLGTATWDRCPEALWMGTQHPSSGGKGGFRWTDWHPVLMGRIHAWQGETSGGSQSPGDTPTVS